MAKVRRGATSFEMSIGCGGFLTLGLAFFLTAWIDIHWLLAYLVGINVATFFLYGYDKIAARRRRRRVPERALHLFALLGGTPFALLARRIFRHKTLKGRFRLVFWCVAVLQLLLIAWFVWRWYRPPS